MSSGRIARNFYTDINGNIQPNNNQLLETGDKHQINFSVERNFINSAHRTSNYLKIPLNQKRIIINNHSLLKAIEVHEFLISAENLTNNEKLSYCKIGRYFMKAFLKEIVIKYENF
jgi:hypothetical protein